MRPILLLLLLAAPAHALEAGDARHLLLRTGFDAPPERVAALARLDRTAAVDALLADVRRDHHLEAPSFVDRGVARRDRAERRKRQRELRGWWLREMVATPSPLTERLTLMWHGHFTSSLRKVKSPLLMYRQNTTLRGHALDRFDALLRAMARDPAMLVYLDGARSKKRAPNENFARELMELFTLGEGRGYSERDIKEAARAFTGWSVRRIDGQFVFRKRWHDRGIKTVLGRTGPLDGDDVIEVLLARPETAERVVRLMWRTFVSPTPDSAKVKDLALRLRAEGFALKPLLRRLLLDDAFWAPANRGALIKSPVELVVGAARALGTPPGDGLMLAQAARRLGQDVFNPPNVAGWPEHTEWITTITLLERENVLRKLSWRTKLAAPEAVALARAPAGPVETAADRLLDPVYQLK